MIEIGEDSFHEYQQGKFDDLWDEYLDWLGLTNRPVDMESLSDWLFLNEGDISEQAKIAMVEYVKERSEDENPM